MRGTILKYIQDKTFGYIVGEDNKKYNFFLSDIEGKIIPHNGSHVEFEVRDPQTRRAKKITLIKPKYESTSYNKHTIFKEITNWKLESKLEDNARYFYLVPEIDALLDGRKSYVIGRKGTGKTAIAEHILQRQVYNHFATKLTFKNFPFNELYKLTDHSFTYPNQYITAWKYIIYSTIIRMMANNFNIDSEIRSQIKKIYPENQLDTLQKSITRWTSAKFKINIFGSGPEIGLEKKENENDSSWIERVETIERILFENLDDAYYYIVFDELDEDYNSSESNRDYMALLTGLFKAVQDIRSIFGKRKCNVFPLIFVRDDIFMQIKDPDKTKWLDITSTLTWTISDLKRMLGFRLSRVIRPSGEPRTFHEIWKEIISVEYVRTAKGNQDPFEYILAKTLQRPRDLVQYLKFSAQACLNQGKNRIDDIIFKAVDNSYSQWLLQDLNCEIYGILPEIEAILNMISHIRKATLCFEEFEYAYYRLLEQKKMEPRDPRDVIEILFNYSVIGNLAKSNTRIFKYFSPLSTINLGEMFVVHRGLYAALQLF